jgi:hypothetical protein
MKNDKDCASGAPECLPRFSLKVLLVFVTVVCIYFASWKWTQSVGTHHVLEYHGAQWMAWANDPTSTPRPRYGTLSVASPMPFVVQMDLVDMAATASAPAIPAYYLCLFGYVIPLSRHHPQHVDLSPVGAAAIGTVVRRRSCALRNNSGLIP